MPVETKKYSNGDITVVWKPAACIHSGICAKGLLEVFNPSRKPWIKLEAATTNKIIEQVNKCPSGALSYFLNSTNSPIENNEDAVTFPTNAIKIQVAVNGPYLIQTDCIIVHKDGREETKTGTIALCRCGASANKPFCDGQHKKVGFEG